jgi:hypothetical protein
MIKTIGLKLLHQGPLEWHYLHSKFHKNLTSSKVISGGHTDRHFGMIEVTFNAITIKQNFIQITNRFKSCTHLRSLNFRHYGILEATGLKIWHRGRLRYYNLHTKFHPNPPISSKVAPPQKFKRPPFWSDGRRLQCHHLHTQFIQIHQSVQKLSGGFFAPASEV